ncbi:Putative alpha/Beta hydrolase [Septoria linicola]|uniref:Alpha/Beta hydrolase n=1 Tax=Septoria linicola TaxID=215465 RepID=A0A9Q9AM42_9PEZI|nr:Putative alpha/Beta hydrolase [Septoria linicola]
MSNYHTVRVSHLGGITAAYQTPKPFETSKPTIVLVNSFVTSSELFRPQFEDERLTDAVNLIAIDPLGDTPERRLSSGPFGTRPS